jgi:flavin reductase (DIM6/NTAB) family NADH-FMN oxidoreductase RutF
MMYIQQKEGVIMAEVGKEMGIFTAGTGARHNGCTVMYGAVGMIWSKPVYFAFIKPERYTWNFVKDSEYFTVSYFPDELKDIHKVYGFKSGRDIDKAKEAGITPEFLEHGIGYKEAREIYVCKIIYVDQMKRELEPDDVVAKYNDPKDMIYGESHYMIIGEIVDHIIR